MDNEEKYIKLIGVGGLVPAKPAKDFKPGEHLVRNYGKSVDIVDVKTISNVTRFVVKDMGVNIAMEFPSDKLCAYSSKIVNISLKKKLS